MLTDIALECIRVEIETQPEELFDRARDWSELLITRQLCEPWFTETPERGITTLLFQDVARLDQVTWRLTLREDARWSDGSRVTSYQLGHQLRKAHQAGGAASIATSHIRQVEAEGSRSLKITTRLPIGDIGRLLTCPSLGPVQIGQQVSSGKYLLGSRTPTQTQLRHVKRQEVIAVTLPHDRQPTTAMGEGCLDATSLTTGGGADWPLPDNDTGLVCTDLDIILGLQLPVDCDDRMADEIDRAIDRTALVREAKGLLRPASMVTDVWAGGGEPDQRRPGGDRLHPGGTFNLQYTDFLPNRAVACEIGRQLLDTSGARVQLVEVPYAEYLESRSVEAGRAFRLILIFPSWSHPAALLTQVYLRYRHDPAQVQGFMDEYIRSLEAASLADAIQHAIAAERQLCNVQRGYIPLGAVVSQFRCRGASPFIPPSGWFDFSELTGRGVDGH